MKTARRSGRKRSRPRRGRVKVGHVRLLDRALDEVRPSPENDRLYRPIRVDDPEIIALARSIADHGIREPLVITEDGWIISGHRRHAAARLAGLATVPCRVEPFRRLDDLDRFTVLLREHNRQRDKSIDEKMREEVIAADPEEAYTALLEHRRARARVDADLPGAFEITAPRARKRISPAKAPLLEAVRRVLRERREFWPLSDRQIHYALLNDPPRRHAAKPGSVYTNTTQSYKCLVDLLTRARVAGLIPMHAIADETRPVITWDVHADPRSFIHQQLDGFMKGYARDLMVSQPNHLEIVAEKNTLLSIIRPVAMEYCIPLTTGRGYCSLPPRQAIASRYQESGKERLILLLVSDFDPDGEEIAQSLARSLRDDFGIASIQPIKVALTAAQVEAHRLPPILKAKATSVHHRKFTSRYGEDVWEVEALPPATLQAILREAIDGVIDTDTLNAEIDRERRDAAYLDGVRQRLHLALGEAPWSGPADDAPDQQEDDA